MQITKDTVIIVTGSSKGLGKALLEDFAAKGAKVYGTFNSSKEEAEKLEARYPRVTMKKSITLVWRKSRLL